MDEDRGLHCWFVKLLLNDDQILTIETTDHAIKKFENCASRAIEPNTVLLAGASNDDTAEMIALQAEIAKLRAFQATITPATTTGAARTGKRAHYRAQGRLSLSPSSRAPSATRTDTMPRVAGTTPRTSFRKQPR
jgi:hypothetical protein